jgi:hypothetical protein
LARVAFRRAWLCRHWKERARIDAAPGLERTAFEIAEWLRARTELIERGTAHVARRRLAVDWGGI